MTVTSGTPFVAPNTNSFAIPNIVLKEAAAGDFADNSTLCVQLNGSGAEWDQDGAAFAVAESTTTDLTVGATVTRDADDASFTIPDESTNGAATITLSGLRIDSKASLGRITADVGTTCGGTEYEANIPIAFNGIVDRAAGSDRYATAQQIAEHFGDVADYCAAGKTVVVARGDNFPDALAASYLAGTFGTPILLTAPNSLPNETIAALKNIGATSVELVGGDQAISNNIQAILDATPVYNCGDGQATGNTLTVGRTFGADRYGTARSVAIKGGVVGTVGTIATASDVETAACGGASQVKTAIVASGENFPDALAAGPLAWAGLSGCGDGSPVPLLLTQANALPAVTSNTITDLGIKQVIVMGGTAAVSGAVATAIDNLTGVDNVARVGGADRQGTAVVFARKVLQHGNNGWVNQQLFISRPDTFPDALAAAPAAGLAEGPLFLAASTTSLGTTTTNGIKDFPVAGVWERATLLGGTAALSAQVATDAGNALAAQG